MKRLHPTACILAGLITLATASAQPALTIYNQNFAVVRENIPLSLKPGVNPIQFDQATIHLEPDSVMLRDPSGKVNLSILEQSFRADVASQGLLLYHYEGQTIDFLVIHNGEETTVPGKIIRSGYTPNTAGMQRYGQAFAMRQNVMGHWQQGAGSPLIEVDGQLRFALPGLPLFPALDTDAILRPTLNWSIYADRSATIEAELSYITGGMSWEAAYNLVSPEKSDTIDIVGWVTMDNQSGKTFAEAAIKLMAGDVSKLQPEQQRYRAEAGLGRAVSAPAPEVTEKAFDEYHLYTLPLPVTLRNRETKQVEFLRATGIPSKTVYVYNGADLGHQRYRGWSDDQFRNQRDYGTLSNPRVWVFREFKNTKENGLGIPLPRGRVRFYREDAADNRLEFTGENTIDHTPRDETVRVYTGDAFDIVGERIRTDYQLERNNEEMEESFQITLRNRKDEPVEVQVHERLYRWLNWKIVESSLPYDRIDSRNIVFTVTLEPGEETMMSYTVRYNWK
jgi:hypothetical protein